MPKKPPVDEAEVIAEDEMIAEGAPIAPGEKDPDELANLAEELARAKQDVLYAQAETQNVRRRLEKDAQDARAYAATGFARDILSVADNLARALAAVTDEMRGDEKLKGFVAGIEATARELDAVFERNGVTKIKAVGETLDPNKHQAMVEIPDDKAEPGTIVQELQTGYLLKDRLLRPALVGVAKKG